MDELKINYETNVAKTAKTTAGITDAICRERINKFKKILIKLKKKKKKKTIKFAETPRGP